MRKIVCAMIAAGMLWGCTTTEESGEELPVINVLLENYDGDLRAEWNAPNEDCTYEVTLYERWESTEGEVTLSPFRTFTTESRSAALTDEIAWYLQEMQKDSVQYPIDLVVGVTAYDGDKAAASGESDFLSIIDLFPPEEAPMPGVDITPEDITEFDLTGSGDTAEMNYGYHVTFDKEDPMYYASYYGEDGYTELEQKATEVFREQLLDVIMRGELYREYVMDPEIEMLDGGEETCRIEWNGMSAGERRYYRLRFSEQDREELMRVLLYINN